MKSASQTTSMKIMIQTALTLNQHAASKTDFKTVLNANQKHAAKIGKQETALGSDQTKNAPSQNAKKAAASSEQTANTQPQQGARTLIKITHQD